MRRAIWGLAGFIALFLALAIPAVVSADVNGGCSATGNSTSGGSIDLTTESEWHMKSTDTASGEGTAPTKMTSASVAAHALGLSIPIASGTDVGGGTSGSVDDVKLSTLAILGARFTVSGTASGPQGSCDGQVTVILDDVNPLMTVLGGGGMALALLGGVILLLSMALGGGIPSRLLAGVFGLLGGAGLGLGLEQMGILNPTTPIGLILAIVGLILGIVLPGLLHSKPPTPNVPYGYPPQYPPQ
jgi:hypothetical protein